MPRGVYPRGRKPLSERLWAKVQKCKADECWPFLGSRNEHGYGSIWDAGKLKKAHTVAYELVHGPVSEGLCVLHHCDNPPCCNPRHLFQGTKKQNSQDAEAKGRLYHHWPKYGPEHPCYRIIPEVRAAIRADTRPHRAIAAAYGISKTQVGRIKREADTAGGNW